MPYNANINWKKAEIATLICDKEQFMVKRIDKEMDYILVKEITELWKPIDTCNFSSRFEKQQMTVYQRKIVKSTIVSGDL